MNKNLFSSLKFLLLGPLFTTSLSADPGIFRPTEYQNNSQPQWEWAMSALQKVSFNDTDKILDVGCGDGKITAWIAEQYSQATVVGLDISEEMIQHASQNFSKENLVFLQANALSIPFEQHFDKLISLCAIHWIVEQERALQSFKNSLKPGGVLLITTPAKHPSSLGPVSEKIAQSDKWASYFPNHKSTRVYRTADEFRALIQQTGFELISLNMTQDMLTFKNKEALLAYIRPLVSFIKHLPQDLQEDFINDIVETQMLFVDHILVCGSMGFIIEKMDIVAIKPN